MKNKKRASPFKFLLSILLCSVVLAALALLYALLIEPNLLIVKKVNITTDYPIKSVKIVLFTDTHFGKLYSDSNAQKIRDKINAQDADIVVFAGDLLDNYARDRAMLDMDKLRQALSDIQAKSGKYAIFGNHDYGGGAQRIYKSLMTECGFTVLVNESVFLPEYDISLVGYDDYLLGYTPNEMYANDYSGFNLLLSHEPVVSELIANSGTNFMLAGHTHGGQVYIPFVTKAMLPEGSGAYMKGKYKQADIGSATDISMYTSSGIGLAKYPLRLLNAPEIVLLSLEGTQSETK